jgi:hypothetical protein
MISLAAPAALDAGSALGRMFYSFDTTPEGADELEKAGVPVLQAMEPPQPVPGEGVPSHVQEDYNNE